MAFYVTLPSNSSLSFFPNNSPSHFYTQLPQSIDLPGNDWEVGLSEISIPNTFYNVSTGLKFMIFEKEKNVDYTKLEKEKDFQKFQQKVLKGLAPGINLEFTLTPGVYSKPQEIIKALNEEISNQDLQELIKFYYKEHKKIIFCYLKNDYIGLYLSKPLQKLLNFKTQIIVESEYAEKIIDLYNEFHTFYVYSNIVQRRVVGDSTVPLLRTVPFKSFTSNILYQRFDKPQYMPVSLKQFSTIEMFITTYTGEPISFGRGNTIITLHFRPSNRLLTV